MSAPFRYRRECSPVGLAAVTGMDLGEAADRLWRVRTFWGARGPTLGPGGAAYGTPLRALGDVLLRLGWGVELWHGERGGRLLADRTMYPALLSTLAHDRARQHRRVTHGQQEDDGGQPASRDDAPDPSTYRSLEDWTDRLRAGYWLYVVRPETDGAPAHLVAYWGGTQLAGNTDGRYDEAPVVKVLRALRPDEPEKRREHA